MEIIKNKLVIVLSGSGRFDNHGIYDTIRITVLKEARDIMNKEAKRNNAFSVSESGFLIDNNSKVRYRLDGVTWNEEGAAEEIELTALQMHQGKIPKIRQ